jgi:hypothetical protein
VEGAVDADARSPPTTGKPPPCSAAANCGAQGSRSAPVAKSMTVLPYL